MTRTRVGRQSRRPISTESQSSPLCAPELLDAAALLDEAELAVEADRGSVVGEDGEAQLVEAAVASRGDGGLEERRADAAAAPLARDGQRDVAVPEPARIEV